MSDHLISRVWNAVTNALRVEQTIGGTAVGTGNEVPVTIAAGTAAIGKLAANSGVDIGDVDVTSTVHPAGISTIAHGERAGSETAVQLATAAAKYVRLKARVSNTGSIWIGNSNAVTKGAGTTTTTCGFQLAAGEDTGWLPATNLNLFWIICDNATDHVTYMVIA